MGMRIPKSFNDLTIEQFQECYFVLGSKPTLDSWIMVISILSGKSKDKVESLPIKELKKEINKLQFLLNPNLNEKVNKFIAVKGRPFKAVLNANEMQTNQVADLKGLMHKEGQSVNDTIVENAHKLLACIYLPLTFSGFRYIPSKHKEVSQYFRKAKMGDVYGTLFFYSNLYKNLIESINTFGKKHMEIVNSHMKEIEDWQTRKENLESDGDGK